MPAKTKKKMTRKVNRAVATPKRSVFAGTGVFGWMVIGIAIGGLIVLLRYLIISSLAPSSVYVIEPSSLIPGMQ